MSLIWLPRAQRELRHVCSYVADDDPIAAQLITQRLVTAVAHLSDFPHAGLLGRVSGTRELVVGNTPYIVPYQIDGEDIIVLAVILSRRRWPEHL